MGYVKNVRGFKENHYTIFVLFPTIYAENLISYLTADSNIDKFDNL